MLRRALLVAVLAVAPVAMTSQTAYAVKDCETQPCFCGTEISVGVPGKDPIVTLGRIDC